MKTKLNIQKFIAEHDDWEILLQEKPYCLTISREVWNGIKLIMFKYNQIDSDFNQEICRECRGLILNEDTLEPISFPFMKFGNVSEGSWVEKIDWDDDPYVLEKCDGSLIKVVKLNGKLLISTNGTILAESAPIAEQIGCESKNFKELFYWALNKQFSNFSNEWFENLFEEGYTYMFELCTIYNRVVVVHNEPKTYFIGVRNNKTFEETYVMDHQLSKIFVTPKTYRFRTFEECVETAKALPWDSEGYVITDRSFRRNKAKSLGYLSCHHMKNNGVLSYERGIDIVRRNEVGEVVAYFPEFNEHLEKIKKDYWAMVEATKNDVVRLDAWINENGYNAQHWLIETGGQNRKDAAKQIFTIGFKNTTGFAFAYLDNKVTSVNAWFDELPTKTIAKMLGYKD